MFSRSATFGVIAALGLTGLSAGGAVARDLTTADIANIQTACSGTDSDSCANVVAGVVAELQQTLSASALESALGAIAAELASISNNAPAETAPAVRQTVVAGLQRLGSAAATTNLAGLSTAVAAIVTQVQAGQPVNFEAVASANDLPPPARPIPAPAQPTVPQAPQPPVEPPSQASPT